MLMAASSSSTDTLSFDAIHYELILYSQENNGSEEKARNSKATLAYSSQGKFKMAVGGVGWKESASGHVVTVKAEEIKQALWFRGYYSGYSLFLESTTADKKHGFHGFPSDA